jgi:hypothetical protein
LVWALAEKVEARLLPAMMERSTCSDWEQLFISLFFWFFAVLLLFCAFQPHGDAHAARFRLWFQRSFQR